MDGAQCDQIVRFFKFSVKNLPTKVAQIFGQFLGCLEKHYIKVKTALVTLWATFGSIWATFNFNIWSHCWRAMTTSIKI